MNATHEMIQGGLLAGFARVDITPPQGVPMAGYTFLRRAEGVRDPLELNALAVSDGAHTAVLLAADVLDLQDNDYARDLRRRIAAAAGVPFEAVYFHCTHTHLSPALGKADPHGETSFDGDPAYSETFIEKACAAAKAAVADLAPATLAVGRAEARRISFIRRFRMKDGSIRTNPGVGNPDIAAPVGEVDESVQVVRFRREGKDEIVAVNFGTHPDTIGGSSISADWPGMARRQLEKAIDGVSCIVFNGALGDVNHVCVDPRPGEREGLARDFDDVDRGYEHARHMGRVIAGAVLSVYGKCAPVAAGEVAFAASEVTVPSQRPKPEELPLARRYAALHAAGKDDDIPFKGMELTTVVAEAGRMLRLENGPDAFTMPVSFVRIGDAVSFVGIPGEPFTEIGRRIKASSPTQVTFVTCITGGYYGYFPTADAYSEGGYEARSSIFGPTVADDLVAAARNLGSSGISVGRVPLFALTRDHETRLI